MQSTTLKSRNKLTKSLNRKQRQQSLIHVIKHIANRNDAVY